MVLSEAGAAGLPLVSTRVAGIPEIARDGETGLLVPPGDAAALGAALRRLIEDADLRRRLGARAIEVVDREYDAEKNTFRLLDLIKGVVDASRAGAR
jgi:glycosyltransferase involved in cell wall biosynthesis